MCLALYLSHASSLYYSSYTLLSSPPFPFSHLLLPLLHPSFLPPPPTSSLLPLPSPSSLSLSLPAHPGHPSPEALDLLRQTLGQLPNTNYTLLKYLMHHLARVVEHSSESIYVHSMHHLVSLTLLGGAWERGYHLVWVVEVSPCLPQAYLSSVIFNPLINLTPRLFVQFEKVRGWMRAWARGGNQDFHLGFRCLKCNTCTQGYGIHVHLLNLAIL